MIPQEALRMISSNLSQAGRRHSVIDPPSTAFPDLTLADGYAVQDLWRTEQESAGRVLAGRKIGLTSRAKQTANGTDEPTSGVIFADTVLENGEEIRLSDFPGAGVEAELAFVLDRDLVGESVNLFDVLDATGFVVPALEVVSTRIIREKSTLADGICDNASMGALIYGGTPQRISQVDLRWISALLYRNGSVEDSGVSAAVLNHPATAVAWLARHLSARGQRLNAGDLILSGSFINATWVRTGDLMLADYGPLGTVSVEFS